MGEWQPLPPTTRAWMARYAERRLTDIWCIPGTHNSACKSAKSMAASIPFAWAKTQRLNIDEQLRAGVRFLDIRLCGDGGTDQKDGSIHVSHTLVTDVPLRTLLNTLAKYLKDFPSETVFLYLRKDYNREAPRSDELQKELHRSGLRFAPFPAEKLEVKLGALQGQVALLLGDGLPSCIDGLSAWPATVLRGKSVCDVWQCASTKAAYKKLEAHLQQPVDTALRADCFRGCFVDGSFPPSPQSLTSPDMNQWLLRKLRTALDSESDLARWPGAQQVGLCVLDFISVDDCNRLIDLCDERCGTPVSDGESGGNPDGAKLGVPVGTSLGASEAGGVVGGASDGAAVRIRIGDPDRVGDRDSCKELCL